MGRVYRRYRNIERSVKAYLETGLALSWSNIQVVFELENEELDTDKPIISVSQDSVPHRKAFEIGETTLEEKFMLVVTVYANSEAVKEDLVANIIDLLATGCTYYTYNNSTDPDTPVATQAGHLNIEFLSDNRVYPSENVETYAKYVQRITFTAQIQA